jgi:hypothetical protein
MAFLIVISVSSLYFGYNIYARKEEGYLIYLITGVFGLMLAAYGANQMKGQIIVIQPIEFNVVTITECEKCGFRNIRKFESGDYVLKTYDGCPKCEGQMVISSIYHEEGQTPSLF